MSKYTRLKIQYIICVVLVLAGLGLLFLGFLVEPLGEIHNSVLIAFGEVSTFAGSLIGIDYNYQVNALKYSRKDVKNEDTEDK